MLFNLIGNRPDIRNAASAVQILEMEYRQHGYACRTHGAWEAASGAAARPGRSGLFSGWAAANNVCGLTDSLSFRIEFRTS